MSLLVIDTELRGLCRQAGLDVEVWDGTVAQLERHATVVMGPDFKQLRAWRAAGHTFGAVVVLDGEPPPRQRALLEPMALLPDSDSLQTALEQLQRGRRAGTLTLRRGTVDLERRILATGEAEVRLTQREVDLLGYLASRPHRDVGRDELQVQVWGHKRPASDTRSVDMAVARLRKKIEHDPSQPAHLLTSRGGGYRLVLTVQSGHNLTAPATSFVGRTRELGVLRDRLDRGARLLSVIGPPGSGKTRLATELCLQLAEGSRFTGGIWLCDLVPTRTTADIVVRLASALSLSLVDEPDALGRIAETLGRRGPTLLFFDNAEHVAEALEPVLRTLVPQAPDLTVLLTSQLRMDLASEHVYDLAPLSANDAEALFLERAAAAGSDVAPSDSLDALLTRLDRLPLALELAARRTRTLAIEDLLAHLSQRLQWLSRGPRDAPERHRALTTALAWAWELLDPSERSTLAGLACFRGAFTAATAARVLGCSVLEVGADLEVLLDRSLVLRRGHRFALLESIRLFALEQAAPEEQAKRREGHAKAFLEIAQRWLPQVGGPRARAALANLTEDAGDLAAAWSTLQVGPLEAFATVARSLDQVHRIHGTPEERLAVLLPVMERAEREGEQAVTAAVAHALGRVHHNRDYDEARRWFTRAATLFEELGQARQAAESLVELAYIDTQYDHRDLAFDALARALALCPDHPLPDILDLHLRQKWRDPIQPGQAERMLQGIDRLAARGATSQAVSAALLASQTLTHLGRYDELSELRRASLERVRLLPDRAIEATVLTELAMESSFAGDYEGALGSMDEVIRLTRDCGGRSALERALLFDATIALHQRDHARCRRHLMEHLESVAALEDGYRMIFGVLLQTCLHMDLDQLDEAGRRIEELRTRVEAHQTPLLRNSLLQVVGIHQLLRGELEPARATLRAAHYPQASPSTVAQTMGLQGVAAARLGDVGERQARGEAVLAALKKTRIPSRHEWQALGEALVAGEPQSVRRFRDGPAHGVLRLTVRGWLPEERVSSRA